MKLKNIEIEPFVNFLMELELKGKESRIRTRFVKLLAEKQKMIQEENYELIKQYSHLDEDGYPKEVERDGGRFFDIKDELREEYNKEYFILMSEEFIIEENEERKDMLLTLQDIILNCDMTFKGNDALVYDRYCEIVEEINYED